MRLDVYTVTVDTVGGAGVAAGNQDVSIPVQGYIEWVYFDFHASAPATTDCILKYASSGLPPAGNIAVTNNTATDALKFPRAKLVDNADAAITDSYDKFPVGGTLNLAVAQSDALTGAVTAYICVSHP